MNPWPPSTAAVVCCRVGDPYWEPTPECVLRRCFRCGHHVIAERDPPEAKMADVPRWEYLCVNCAAVITDAGTEWRR